MMVNKNRVIGSSGDWVKVTNPGVKPQRTRRNTKVEHAHLHFCDPLCPLWLALVLRKAVVGSNCLRIVYIPRFTSPDDPITRCTMALLN